MGEATDAGATDPAGRLDSSELLRVLDTAVNPFCVTNLVGDVLWASGAIEELLGLSPAELVGRSLLELVAPASLPTALESLAAGNDYIHSRPDGPTGWEGAGPIVELIRADGSTLHCAVAVATPVRTGLSGFVMQLRRAEAVTALEDALAAMSRGDDIASILRHVIALLAGELPDVDVAVAHRCTPDDQVQVVGSPAGLEEAFWPGVLAGTPWQAVAEDPGLIVDHTTDDLPEPLRTTALGAGYRWRTATGVTATGPGQHRAYVAVWSRHAYESHVFSHQRIRRAAGHVGLVVQWEEGRRALEWAVTHDGLTGLANRSAFIGQLDEQRDQGLTAVLYLDLDDFKPINDDHGHALGDRVLAEVATRLRHAVRPTDVVARLGGDEFAVLCPDIGDLAAAGALAERLMAAVADPITVDGVAVRVGLSVGIAELVAGEDADGVLARADEALRHAKTQGKRGWVAR